MRHFPLVSLSLVSLCLSFLSVSRFSVLSVLLSLSVRFASNDSIKDAGKRITSSRHLKDARKREETKKGDVSFLRSDTGSVMTKPKSSAIQGSLLWCAPEVFVAAAPSTASDVYAIGIMIFEVIFKEIP